MTDKDKTTKPDTDDPENPRDYNPEHEYPHEQSEIKSPPEKHLVEDPGYEDDVTDEKGRQPGMRRTGEFIVPDDNNIAGEGWTLPTRDGGGWDHPVEPNLEEQIDEPARLDKRKADYTSDLKEKK